MQILSKKKQKRKVVIIFLLLMSFSIPTYGDIFSSGIIENDFDKLSIENNYNTSLAIHSSDRDSKQLLPATGFVLCEILNLGNTRLNVCFLKKDITTESILDMNRLFLEVKLNF